MRLLEEKLKGEMEQKEKARQDAVKEVDIMKNNMSSVVEQQLETKIGQIDAKYQLEKNELNEQIANIKGSYNDLRTNLYKNEQIRKV